MESINFTLNHKFEWKEVGKNTNNLTKNVEMKMIIKFIFSHNTKTNSLKNLKLSTVITNLLLHAWK